MPRRVQSLFRRIALNTVAKAASIAARLVVGLALTPFILRSVGTADYGVWVLVLGFSVGGGILSIFTLGIGGALVKYVAEDAARGDVAGVNRAFTASLLTYSVFGLLGALVLVAISASPVLQWLNVPAEYATTTRLLFLLLAVQTLLELPGLAFDGILEGLQRYPTSAAIEIMRVVAWAGGVIAALAAGWGLVGLGAIQLASTALVVTALALAAKRAFPPLKLSRGTPRATYSRILRMSNHLLVIRITAVITQQADKIIISALLTPLLLAYYNVASYPQSLVVITLGFTASVILPLASALSATGDSSSLRALFLRGTKFTVAQSVPFAVGAFILAPYFIEAWVGPEFASAVLLARVWLAYPFFACLLQVGWNMMIGVGRVREVVVIQTFGAAAKVVASVALAWPFGMVGVVVGTVAGSLLSLGPYVRLFLRETRVSLSEFIREALAPGYLPALAAGVVLAAAVAVRAPSGLVEVAVYGIGELVAFGALFYAFGMTAAERAGLLRLLLRKAESAT